ANLNLWIEVEKAREEAFPAVATAESPEDKQREISKFQLTKQRLQATVKEEWLGRRNEGVTTTRGAFYRRIDCLTNHRDVLTDILNIDMKYMRSSGATHIEAKHEEASILTQELLLYTKQFIQASEEFQKSACDALSFFPQKA
ncbi:hypothetical protein CSUI_007235, partial [Cystoisospora suis]